ncbi:MAG: hypothetical protein ACM3O6_11375 [Acidobacteriota bacterium]
MLSRFIAWIISLFATVAPSPTLAAPQKEARTAAKLEAKARAEGRIACLRYGEVWTDPATGHRGYRPIPGGPIDANDPSFKAC